MSKRQKWNEAADCALSELVAQANGELEWAAIAKKMRSMGFRKDRKQVSERWLNILNPNLDTSSLSDNDIVKLFDLHQRHQNQWRKIASYFPGKTDNLIKNKFFALTRKALRLASKLVDRPNSTQWVNSLKPKVISDLMDRKFDFRGSGPESPFRAPSVSAREVVLFLNTEQALSKHFTPSEDVKKVMVAMLDSLDSANEEYQSKVVCETPTPLIKKISKDPSKVLLKDRVPELPKLNIKKPSLTTQPQKDMDKAVISALPSAIKATPSPGQLSFYFIGKRTPRSVAPFNEGSALRPIESTEESSYFFGALEKEPVETPQPHLTPGSRYSKRFGYYFKGGTEFEVPESSPLQKCRLDNFPAL